MEGNTNDIDKSIYLNNFVEIKMFMCVKNVDRCECHDSLYPCFWHGKHPVRRFVIAHNRHTPPE